MGEKNPAGTTAHTIDNDEVAEKSPPKQAKGTQPEDTTTTTGPKGHEVEQDADGKVHIELPEPLKPATGDDHDRLTPQAGGFNGPGEPHGIMPDPPKGDQSIHEVRPTMAAFINPDDVPEAFRAGTAGNPGVHDYLTQALTEMRTYSKTDKSSRDLSIAITHVEDALARLDKTDIR